MRDRFFRIQRPGETGTTNDCLEEPVDAGSRACNIENQVISAFVTKDIILEALVGGFSNDNDTARSASRLEHQLWKCVADIVKDQIDGDVFPQDRTHPALLDTCSTLSRHYSYPTTSAFYGQYSL
ncbi:hypothetical protein BGZ88_005505 [Linnemannia elongata]|nr:hypothetical protein BGZ88_005505 [Linnemannia elongata]